MYLYTYEAVVPRAEWTPPDIDRILILRLPITPIHTLGGGLVHCPLSIVLCPFRHKPILVVIPTLLDKGGEPVTLGLVVILHAVAQVHLVAENISAYVERAVEPRISSGQSPMHPHILRLRIRIARPLGIHHIAAVGVILVDIRALLDLVRKSTT